VVLLNASFISSAVLPFIAVAFIILFKVKKLFLF